VVRWFDVLALPFGFDSCEVGVSGIYDQTIPLWHAPTSEAMGTPSRG